jgi:hypothetical protein
MNEGVGEQAADAAGQSMVATEAARREAAWPPLARWLALQRTISWAAAQRTVQRNTPAACLEQERRFLAADR